MNKPIIIPGPQEPNIVWFLDQKIKYIKWKTFVQNIIENKHIISEDRWMLQAWLNKKIHIKCYPLDNKQCPDCIYLAYAKEIMHACKRGSPRHKRLVRRNFYKEFKII